MWNHRNVQRTIKDLYEWQQSHASPIGERYLLSNFTSNVDTFNDFWDEYKNNHAYYDWYFMRRYRNFRYYGQDVDGDNPVEDVYLNFVDEVYTFLMLNDKKYTELYRIEKLQNNPSPTSDYNVSETHNKTLSSEYVSGEREDRGNNVMGASSSTRIDSTKAYNSTDFVEVGKSVNTSQPRTDTSSVSKGEQTDTETKTYTESYTSSGSKGSPSENLEKYKEVWSNFSFYTMVFDDICKELLLI